MGQAMAIDSKGNCYSIPEEIIKKHGKKLPKGRFDLTKNEAPPTSEVEGQGDWFVCSWTNSHTAHINCGGGQ
jgi:hypothetical protein